MLVLDDTGSTHLSLLSPTIGLLLALVQDTHGGIAIHLHTANGVSWRQTIWLEVLTEGALSRYFSQSK